MNKIEIHQSGSRRHLGNFWAVVDNTLACLIFAPLVVGYWRGTWTNISIYLYPDDIKTSGFISASFGFCGCLLMGLLQFTLKKHFSKPGKIKWLVVYHVYSYVYGMFVVSYWRGVWLLWDYYTGINLLSVVICFAIGLGALVLLRGSKNIAAPPVGLLVDTDESFFDVSTRFSCKPSDSVENFVLDVLLTVGVVGSLIIFFWRSTWTAMDIWLFPEDATKTAWASLVIGYSLVFMMMVLQRPISWLSFLVDKRKLIKVIIEDVHYFLANLGTIFMWRGLWLTFDLYLLPDNPTLSNWYTHGVGILVLMLFLNGNSVLNRSCILDGEDILGKGAILPNKYFRILLAQSKCGNYEHGGPNPDADKSQVTGDQVPGDQVSSDTGM